MRLANAELHEHQALQQAYAALLGRLRKFDGKKMALTFIQSLEKQLRDYDIPEGKWLSALESCLVGSANDGLLDSVVESRSPGL